MNTVKGIGLNQSPRFITDQRIHVQIKNFPVIRQLLQLLIACLDPLIVDVISLIGPFCGYLYNALNVNNCFRLQLLKMLHHLPVFVDKGLHGARSHLINADH